MNDFWLGASVALFLCLMTIAVVVWWRSRQLAPKVSDDALSRYLNALTAPVAVPQQSGEMVVFKAPVPALKPKVERHRRPRPTVDEVRMVQRITELERELELTQAELQAVRSELHDAPASLEIVPADDREVPVARTYDTMIVEVYLLDGNGQEVQYEGYQRGRVTFGPADDQRRRYNLHEVQFPVVDRPVHVAAVNFGGAWVVDVNPSIAYAPGDIPTFAPNGMSFRDL